MRTITLILSMSAARTSAKTVPARTNVECKGSFPGGKHNAEGGRDKCVSICISKHGILTAKRPLVSGNAPNTPPHG